MGIGSRVSDFGCRVSGLGSRVSGLGFRIYIPTRAHAPAPIQVLSADPKAIFRNQISEGEHARSARELSSPRRKYIYTQHPETFTLFKQVMLTEFAGNFARQFSSSAISAFELHNCRTEPIGLAKTAVYWRLTGRSRTSVYVKPTRSHRTAGRCLHPGGCNVS